MVTKFVNQPHNRGYVSPHPQGRHYDSATFTADSGNSCPKQR
jgi:hypothetical protein